MFNSYQQDESWSRAQCATEVPLTQRATQFARNNIMTVRLAPCAKLVSKPYKTRKFTSLKQYSLNIAHSLILVFQDVSKVLLNMFMKTLRYLGYLGYLGYLRYLGSGGFRNSIPSIPTIPSIPRYLRYLQQVSSFGTLQNEVARIP